MACNTNQSPMGGLGGWRHNMMRGTHTPIHANSNLTIDDEYAMADAYDSSIDDCAPLVSVRKVPLKIGRSAALALTRTEASRTNAKTHFLSLPGELRNRIYAYCIEDPSAVFELSWKDSDTCNARPLENEREFFSLTQSCRQIRTEFLAKWTAHAQIRINIQCAKEFLDTFVFSLSKQGLRSTMTLVVDASHVWSFYTRSPGLGVDLIPLIKSTEIAPELGLTLSGLKISEERDLHELFVKRDTKWHAWVEAAVTKIMIGTESAAVSVLKFFVRPEHAEPWMSLTAEEQYPSQNEEVRRWNEDMGRPATMDHFVSYRLDQCASP
ncbi:hypothetical protein EJ04DRAFT_554361 [Polyplosphaeria fusca]|uniref:F-box domain-containing protein n=1 Tax=Polyplosphaeria fusca TaxID=682080 RepID=A0A9P4QVR8_9PLEO|nr:hypothetical protein EJ04DRAFT_554361 [Polyplosphaeria fusca]